MGIGVEVLLLQFADSSVSTKCVPEELKQSVIPERKRKRGGGRNKGGTDMWVRAIDEIKESSKIMDKTKTIGCELSQEGHTANILQSSQV